MKNDRREQANAVIANLGVGTDTRSTIERLLESAYKEVQRETRYAAIDKLNEIRERYESLYGETAEVERMMNEITGAIHNLKYE